MNTANLGSGYSRYTMPKAPTNRSAGTPNNPRATPWGVSASCSCFSLWLGQTFCAFLCWIGESALPHKKSSSLLSPNWNILKHVQNPFQVGRGLFEKGQSNPFWKQPMFPQHPREKIKAFAWSCSICWPLVGPLILSRITWNLNSPLVQLEALTFSS